MSRKLVYKTLEFDKPERAPRDIWILPWADLNYPEQVKKLKNDFPQDIKSAGGFAKQSSVVIGDMHTVGTYVDPWGCVFENIQEGIHGEIQEPIVQGEEWDDVEKVHFPYEWFNIDVEGVNSYCKNNDMFVLPGFCARPFERLQFIRGTEQFYMDLVLRPDGMMDFIKKLHKFNLNLMESWAKTDVDALFMMDDWGAQNNLLISPDIWVEIFKPMYKDYCDLAKAYGKKMFMHSDGHILKIYPHLIEIGVDALNSQIFCMGLENLAEYAGKITFWGEMDRQHMLSDKEPADIDEAVREIKELLWKDGGCIAQCEFGPGGKPENVIQTFESWNNI
ncbi:MAG: methyltransferase, partial [Clostridiales bacterium]|nr:methyltransferase [Clostridiales bacterium]